jgi:Putative peptidoglycan binding domain
MATPAPASRQALNDANARWPNRSKASDGIMGDAAHQKRKSDHNDGNAVDVTHDPSVGCSGDVIAAHALTDVRTKYVIWNRRINTLDGRGWRTYTGKNPHTKHCHISILATARNDTRAWGWRNAELPVPSQVTEREAATAGPSTAGAAGAGVANTGASNTGAPAAGSVARKTVSQGAPPPPTPPGPPPPTIVPHAYPGIPIEIGARGLNVRRIQTQLKHRGWEITVDADFGPLTKRVVQRFQDRKQLAVDGIVGPRTWKALWR